MQQQTSPSYALTVRVEYDNDVGMLGRLTSVIGNLGANIGAVDVVRATRTRTTRDISFLTNDEEHSRDIIQAVREIPGVDVIHVSDRTFLMHLGGKFEIKPKIPIKNRDDLSMVYMPGVARVARAISENPQDVFNLSIKKNMVAVISDGSNVLHLGNVGPFAVLPVLETKVLFHKEFAGNNAFPLPLQVENVDQFVEAVKAIAPAFGAIHLEDVASPACFEIEERLSAELDIPVLHNDQHGTAIVVLAALINSLKILDKTPGNLRLVINGPGPAGLACGRLARLFGVADIIFCDAGGAIHQGRDDLNPSLEVVARLSNPRQFAGTLAEALVDADVFIGFGRRTVLTREDIARMSRDAVVISVAHPEPDVDPESIADVARIVATGRSDLPNQMNNMLCFPGFFKGLLQSRAAKVNDAMKLAAAHAIADVIGRDELSEDYIIPGTFDRRVATAVAEAVAGAAKNSGVARQVNK
jgi:malate dehydrogenase (oxaloacetate-decarboxylating)